MTSKSLSPEVPPESGHQGRGRTRQDNQEGTEYRKPLIYRYRPGMTDGSQVPLSVPLRRPSRGSFPDFRKWVERSFSVRSFDTSGNRMKSVSFESQGLRTHHVPPPIYRLVSSVLFPPSFFT